MKNFLKIIFLLTFLSSCGLTKKLWNPTYRDRIKQFLVSENGRNVIFLSDKYHYILNDNNGSLKRILFSKYRYLLFLDGKHSFVNLGADNSVEVNIAIQSNSLKPPLDAANHLMSLGFRDYKGQALFIKMRLYGTRYLASQNFNLYTNSLNRVYDIEVRRNISADKKIAKIALTPLTLTADAVILFGRVILWPLSSN